MQAEMYVYTRICGKTENFQDFTRLEKLQKIFKVLEGVNYKHQS